MRYMLINNRWGCPCRSMRIRKERGAGAWFHLAIVMGFKTQTIIKHPLKSYSHKIKLILTERYKMQYSHLKLRHHQKSHFLCLWRNHRRTKTSIQPKHGSHRQIYVIMGHLACATRAAVQIRHHAKKITAKAIELVSSQRRIVHIRRCLMRRLYSLSSNRVN